LRKAAFEAARVALAPSQCGGEGVLDAIVSCRCPDNWSPGVKTPMI